MTVTLEGYIASLLICMYMLEGGYTVRERNKKQVIKQKRLGKYTKNT